MTSQATGGRRSRADAVRNRQRLIDAAAEVFAARGLEATLDDIARHAGVNVATAYRHFSNKHELAREFLRQCVDKAIAVAEEASAVPDPWQGLTQFLERSLELMASNRALVDIITHAYDTEPFEQLIEGVDGPVEALLARGREAGVIRADVRATDFAAILEMLCTITGLDVPSVPYLPHRYIGLILAGLRPGEELPGEPPTRDTLLAVAATQKHVKNPVTPAAPKGPPGR
jgi:AcrR family transcriptional regulator